MMNRKKFRYCFLILLFFVCFASFGSTLAKAKEVVQSRSLTNIFGDTLGIIEIYDTGDINIKYKYGLKKAEVYYCEKGTNCDSDLYNHEVIVASDYENPHKNDSGELASYSHKVSLEKTKEYKLKVKAYVATGKSYTGTENVSGNPIIVAFQTETSDDVSVKGTPSSGQTVGDEGIDDMLGKLKYIVNTVVLPIMYIVVGLVLIIKGAILGTQIVKSADDPDVRAQKIHSLKWLVIGVAVTFLGGSVVGIVTGFFENAFK